LATPKPDGVKVSIRSFGIEWRIYCDTLSMVDGKYVWDDDGPEDNCTEAQYAKRWTIYGPRCIRTDGFKWKWAIVTFTSQR
jgi:hypothetical protein